MKNDKKEENKPNIKIFLIFGIIILLVVCFFIFIKFEKSKTSSTNEGPGSEGSAGGEVQVANVNAGDSNPITPSKIYTLNNEQINIINRSVLSSEFISDLPDKGVIALKFYDFIDENRIWIKEMLIGKDGFLSEGEPDMILMMHARYIYQLNETNLCDVINTAKTNGEMWVESEESDAKLFFKYSGMMKYKDCLGF